MELVTGTIDIRGARVRVNGTVDAAALRQVLNLSRESVMIIELPVRPGLSILVTAQPVDFRCGMDFLAWRRSERMPKQ